MESVVSDQPVRTAPADLKRHFTQTSESPFSRVARHIVFRWPDPEDRIFNRVISDISVVLRETTLTISHSIETGSPAFSCIHLCSWLRSRPLLRGIFVA